MYVIPYVPPFLQINTLISYYSMVNILMLIGTDVDEISRAAFQTKSPLILESIF